MGIPLVGQGTDVLPSRAEASSNRAHVAEVTEIDGSTCQPHLAISSHAITVRVDAAATTRPLLLGLSVLSNGVIMPLPLNGSCCVALTDWMRGRTNSPKSTSCLAGRCS